MEFEDSEFEMIIDKGTLDAIACENFENQPGKLIQEYLRVVKIRGRIMIVSHSDLSFYGPLIQEYSQDYEISVQVFKQGLSQEINMLNILRAIGVGSLEEVRSNQEKLKELKLRSSI